MAAAIGFAHLAKRDVAILLIELIIHIQVGIGIEFEAVRSDQLAVSHMIL